MVLIATDSPQETWQRQEMGQPFSALTPEEAADQRAN